jgi:hypothetical protein
LIPEGYELIDGEYVRKIDLLSPREIQNHIEKDIVNFFDKLGLDIKNSYNHK